MGDSYPHIALPLNVGFAHSRNVSDVTSMFLPACILLANMVLSAAASRVTTCGCPIYRGRYVLDSNVYLSVLVMNMSCG